MNTNASRSTIDLLGASACVLMIFAAYVFGVRGWVNARATSEQALKETAAIAMENKKHSKIEQAISTHLDAIQSTIKTEGIELTDGSDLTARLIDLGSIAEHYGVSIDTLTPKPREHTTDTARGFDRQPISLRCSGTYPDFVAMLNAFRTNHPDIAMRALSINHQGTANAASLDAELVWFVQPTPLPGR